MLGTAEMALAAQVLVQEQLVHKYFPVGVLMIKSWVICHWNRKTVQINIFDGASSAYGADHYWPPFSKMAAKITLLTQ